jgi:hypothetical protein
MPVVDEETVLRVEVIHCDSVGINPKHLLDPLRRYSGYFVQRTTFFGYPKSKPTGRTIQCLNLHDQAAASVREVRCGATSREPDFTSMNFLERGDSWETLKPSKLGRLDLMVHFQHVY